MVWAASEARVFDAAKAVFGLWALWSLPAMAELVPASVLVATMMVAKPGVRFRSAVQRSLLSGSLVLGGG